jgi:hypothetical protein
MRYYCQFIPYILIIYLCEIILGGASGFQLYGISIRKVLLFILIGGGFFRLIIHPIIYSWQLYLLTFIMFVVIVWGGIVPLFRGVDLSQSLAEFLPLCVFLLIIPVLDSVHLKGIRLYLNVANWCAATIATVVIVAWVSATFFMSTEFALLVKLFFLAVTGSDSGYYIGPMPDGSYRVMWISCIFFPLMLAYKNVDKIQFKWTTFYLIAIYASGTRSFLYASLLLVFYAYIHRYKKYIWHFLVGMICLVTIILCTPDLLNESRLFNVSSEFDSDSARGEQLLSLLNLFNDNLFFGAGFGAHAEVVRSVEAPYSYELTYIALLAKLGVFGSVLVIIILTMAVCKAFLIRLPNIGQSFVIATAFLFITATNPYLLNLVGLTISVFMMAFFLSYNFNTLNKSTTNWCIGGRGEV